VEYNLAALRILENEVQVQEKAVVAAQKYLELANTRYTGGVTSYLEVTTAQSAALSDELTAVNILGRRMVDGSHAGAGPRWRMGSFFFARSS
jgi:outer membrane protein TolC